MTSAVKVDFRRDDIELFECKAQRDHCSVMV
jgi:hypothetical protein